MSTEESPLLGDQLQPNTSAQCDALPTEDVYNRFSCGQKRVILAIVSLTGLFPMFVSGCFVPSIPQISKDLNSTPAAVSLAVSLAVFASSLSVMFWSAYTSFYGRRAIYLCGMPISILGSFAVAASADLNSLLFWRFVQTFGCAGGYALGAATIGDIYRAEKRGTAMGTYFGATLSGLAIAPPVGGALAQYWSWRGLQASLGVWGVIQLLLLAFFLPETAHPGSRGIDKARGRNKLFVWINPFRCLTFLRSPNIMAITLANTFAVISDFVLLIPIAYTVGAKYGITGEGLIGALLLPCGFGNFVGAPIGGRMSDAALRRAKEERKGVWVPEDRLRGVWFGGLVLIPISVALSGFTTAYVDGMVGLVINLVCLFANGVGVDMAVTPIGTYTVDIMPSRSAEVMGAITALRSLLLAPVSALIIPSIETIGVVATNSISGILALFGYLLIWLTIRYGERMRAYVDIGYPDFSTGALKDDEPTT
ncbi:major facilitator superfamily domain-containing protein [Boletus coccyginus]|nr:major facilitator superfamily domain-containing protein [Boletus coccyginus]